MSSSERNPTLTTPPVSAPSGEPAADNGASHATLFRRSGVAPALVANSRDRERREWLMEHVARRHARRATVALLRSRHLPDAAAADPELQTELARLLNFLKQAPGTADLDGADVANIAASVRPPAR
jgi:hypothetical protein